MGAVTRRCQWELMLEPSKRYGCDKLSMLRNYRAPYRRAMVQYCTTMQPRQGSLNFPILCFLRAVKPMLLSVSPHNFPFQVVPVAMLVFSYSTHKGGEETQKETL